MSTGPTRDSSVTSSTVTVSAPAFSARSAAAFRSAAVSWEERGSSAAFGSSSPSLSIVFHSERATGAAYSLPVPESPRTTSVTYLESLPAS